MLKVNKPLDKSFANLIEINENLNNPRNLCGAH